MAIPVLIIGKSGAGKSTSLRNCVDNPDWNIIKVLNKPLPFKGKIPAVVTDDYASVMKCCFSSKAQNIVIDDAGYLLTNMFMRGHSTQGQGNAQFQFYNKIGDCFWNLIEFITNKVQSEKIVYIMMHEDKNDFGDIKPKTIGKLLDEKVCIEGMFTVCLHAAYDNSQHVFFTQGVDGSTAKSPMGMFPSERIDNDLILVETAIRNYYDMATDNTTVQTEESVNA